MSPFEAGCRSAGNENDLQIPTHNQPPKCPQAGDPSTCCGGGASASAIFRCISACPEKTKLAFERLSLGFRVEGLR